MLKLKKKKPYKYEKIIQESCDEMTWRFKYNALEFYTISNDNKMIGFFTLHKNAKHNILSHIYFTPENRNKGYCKQLLNQLFDKYDSLVIDTPNTQVLNILDCVEVGDGFKIVGSHFNFAYHVGTKLLLCSPLAWISKDNNSFLFVKSMGNVRLIPSDTTFHKVKRDDSAKFYRMMEEYEEEFWKTYDNNVFVKAAIDMLPDFMEDFEQLLNGNI